MVGLLGAECVHPPTCITSHCSRAAFLSGSKIEATARRDPRRSGNLYSASSSKQAPTEGTVKTLSVLPSHRIDHLRRGAVLVVKAGRGVFEECKRRLLSFCAAGGL